MFPSPSCPSDGTIAPVTALVTRGAAEQRMASAVFPQDDGDACPICQIVSCWAWAVRLAVERSCSHPQTDLTRQLCAPFFPASSCTVSHGVARHGFDVALISIHANLRVSAMARSAKACADVEGIVDRDNGAVYPVGPNPAYPVCTNPRLLRRFAVALLCVKAGWASQ